MFLTGATGFIGREVARLLLGRGDHVVMLVRDVSRADRLVALGAAPMAGELADEAAIRAGMTGCDAAIHAAAVCAVGLPAAERRAMYRTNVLGTERVLRVAGEAGIGRVVHVSTVNALGHTDGRVVDERHRHSGRFVSYYDETKHLAHEIAVRAAADAQDVVIAMPGLAYGPGDPSATGVLLQRFVDGRLPVAALVDVGVSAVHRDDVAVGIVACLDRGRRGEAYVLGGQITTLRGMIDVLATLTGRRPPAITVPPGVLRLVARLGRDVAGALGLPPNVGEAIRAGHGVTYWASHDKAGAELGYSPRSLSEGLRTLVPAVPSESEV